MSKRVKGRTKRGKRVRPATELTTTVSMTPTRIDRIAKLLRQFEQEDAGEAGLAPATPERHGLAEEVEARRRACQVIDGTMARSASRQMAVELGAEHLGISRTRMRQMFRDYKGAQEVRARDAALATEVAHAVRGTEGRKLDPQTGLVQEEAGPAAEAQPQPIILPKDAVLVPGMEPIANGHARTALAELTAAVALMPNDARAEGWQPQAALHLLQAEAALRCAVEFFGS